MLRESPECWGGWGVCVPWVLGWGLGCVTLILSFSRTCWTSAQATVSRNACSFTELIFPFSSCSCSRNSGSVTGASRMVLGGDGEVTQEDREVAATSLVPQCPT